MLSLSSSSTEAKRAGNRKELVGTHRAAIVLVDGVEPRLDLGDGVLLPDLRRHHSHELVEIERLVLVLVVPHKGAHLGH